ncbi:MAG: diguanylate cyclase [Isosphaeraceae bacterium]
MASLTACVFCVLQSAGEVPDPTPYRLASRKEFCESVAIFCSVGATRNDPEMVAGALQKVAERNPEIRALRFRVGAEPPLVEAGEVASLPPTSSRSTANPDLAQIPIFVGGVPWGDVSLRFHPLFPPGRFGFLSVPLFRFLAFLTLGVLVSSLLYLQLVLGRRNNHSAIPDRVRATLDTLVEGVLLLDKDQRIAMANASFASTIGRDPAELEGRTVEELAWSWPRSRVEEKGETLLPWAHAVREQETLLGAIVGLRTDDEELRTMSVNSTPILADDGVCHGVLATFDDMTEVELKNRQLHQALLRLRRSKAKIREANQKLMDLATLDPLTGCLNRRSFFERFERIWDASRLESQAPLACVMLDIDHFKSVNDRFGHAVGDQAIQMVARVLREGVRKEDSVCRYGGEEFCVLLPGVDEAEASAIADRFRLTVQATEFAGTRVTSSFGVSSASMGAEGPKALLDQADQALYGAKKSGRNRVVRFDQMPDLPRVEDLKVEAKVEQPPVVVVPAEAGPDASIPYHAVASLISALAHRDPATAEHSRRVANLCLLIAKGLLSERRIYTLEVAALLHDIGKLGIPDAILKKPGALTEDDWSIMRSHDAMSVEIVASAFSCERFREIIATHHAWFSGNPRDPGLPSGDAILLESRILAAADSYDAMVSDRVYRRGTTRDLAFRELRRCAGQQFDPEIVERLIACVGREEDRPDVEVAPVSKQEALKIGLLIERLANALDARDTVSLGHMAERLQSTAASCGIVPMVELATQLHEAIRNESDWLSVVQLGGDLLEQCRLTQATYLARYAPDRDGELDQCGTTAKAIVEEPVAIIPLLS